MNFVSKLLAMKNILFANDFSDTSEMALTYAVEFSAKLKAKLTILHIHDISALLANPTEIPYFPSTNVEFLEVQKKKMEEQLLFVAGEKAKQIEIYFDAIEHTSVSMAIIEKTEECKTDLLVMGVKGNKKFQEFFLGNNTKSVITDCQCAVLVVPFGTHFQNPDKIVFASDFGDDNFEALHALSKLATNFNSKIVILHISTDYETFSLNKMNDFKKQLTSEIDYPNLSFEFLLSNDINKRLDEFINENNIQLITMVEHENKGFFRRLFESDHVKNMISLAKIPILCYNQKYLVKSSFEEAEAKLNLNK
jgi:nucleotide-binding universal stress UspA family protein